MHTSRSLIRIRISSNPEHNVKGGIILGKEQFVAKVEKLIDNYKAVKEIPKKQRFRARRNLDKIFGNGVKNSKRKNELIYDAYINNGYTLKEVGDYLKIHYSTVSKIVKEVKIQNSRLEHPA